MNMKIGPNVFIILLIYYHQILYYMIIIVSTVWIKWCLSIWFVSPLPLTILYVWDGSWFSSEQEVTQTKVLPCCFDSHVISLKTWILLFVQSKACDVIQTPDGRDILTVLIDCEDLISISQWTISSLRSTLLLILLETQHTNTVTPVCQAAKSESLREILMHGYGI